MERMRGTMQDDVVKEDVARGTYMWPVAPSIRLTTDLLHLGVGILPAFNMISVRAFHIREVGATAAQEVAITLANAEAYVQAALEQGFIRDEVERSAYEARREIEAGLRTVVGVNAYVPKGDAVEPEVQLPARGLEAVRGAALRAHRVARVGVATRAARPARRGGGRGSVVSPSSRGPAGWGDVGGDLRCAS